MGGDQGGYSGGGEYRRGHSDTGGSDQGYIGGGEYRRGHSDTGGSDQGYIGGGEYRRGHRGAEARYRYNGYQESSYQAASGISWCHESRQTLSYLSLIRFHELKFLEDFFW